MAEPPSSAGGGPGEVDLSGPAGCCQEFRGGARDGGEGGGVGDVGGVAGAVGVDGGDAVVAGGGSGEPGVGVGCVGVAGGGDAVGPRRAGVGGDLDLVAAEGVAAVAGRGGPGQVAAAAVAGRSEEAGRGAGHGAGVGGVGLGEGRRGEHGQREHAGQGWEPRGPARGCAGGAGPGRRVRCGPRRQLSSPGRSSRTPDAQSW